MSTRFAAVVPVGPSQADLVRLRGLLNSLFDHEENLGWLILVDDSSLDRNFSRLVHVSKSCDVICIKNPRAGYGIGYLGGLAVGVLAGLEWLSERADPAFTIKLDTDALVIGSFAQSIRTTFDARSEVGIVGTIGRTANRREASFGFEQAVPSPLVMARRRWCDVHRRCNGDEARMRACFGEKTVPRVGRRPKKAR